MFFPLFISVFQASKKRIGAQCRCHSHIQMARNDQCFRKSINVYKSNNSLAYIACNGAMSRSNSTFHSFCHFSGLACYLTAIIVAVGYLVLCQWIRNHTNWKTRISTVIRLINSAVLLCTDLLASQCFRDIVKTQEGCTPQCTSRPTFTRLCAKATRIGQLASCTPTYVTNQQPTADYDDEFEEGNNGCDQSGSGNKEPQEQWATVVCIRMKAGQDLGSEPQLHACTTHTHSSTNGASLHMTPNEEGRHRRSCQRCRQPLPPPLLEPSSWWDSGGRNGCPVECHTHLQSPRRGS